MNLDKIINWNVGQRTHVEIIQNFILEFCTKLTRLGIMHDRSKLSKTEFEGFLESHDSLRSDHPNDDRYQKALKSKAIQHHYKWNTHHPEYWRDKQKNMPLLEIIIMFFDWQSRALARNFDFKVDNSYQEFREYNFEKLKENGQEHAIPIVELLEEMFPEK